MSSPQKRAAAEQGGAEPRALLVHECRDDDRPRRLEALGAQHPHRVDRRDHAERAVEVAAMRDRVEVRARHHRPGAAVAARRRPPRQQVAGAVARDREPELGQRAADEGDRRLELRRPREPGDPAALDAVAGGADPRGGGEIRGQRGAAHDAGAVAMPSARSRSVAAASRSAGSP